MSTSHGHFGFTNPMPTPPQSEPPATPLMSDNGFPRRIRLDLFCAAERAIYDAVQRVEEMGADLRLTDAVNLLGKAREKVADFEDDRLRRAAPPSASGDTRREE